MNKRFVLLTTSSCSKCPKIKAMIAEDSDLASLIEIKDAMNCKEFCVEKKIMSVPTIWDSKTERAVNVGYFTKEELDSLVKGVE